MSVSDITRKGTAVNIHVLSVCLSVCMYALYTVLTLWTQPECLRYHHITVQQFMCHLILTWWTQPECLRYHHIKVWQCIVCLSHTHLVDTAWVSQISSYQGTAVHVLSVSYSPGGHSLSVSDIIISKYGSALSVCLILTWWTQPECLRYNHIKVQQFMYCLSHTHLVDTAWVSQISSYQSMAVHCLSVSYSPGGHSLSVSNIIISKYGSALSVCLILTWWTQPECIDIIISRYSSSCTVCLILTWWTQPECLRYHHIKVWQFMYCLIGWHLFLITPRTVNLLLKFVLHVRVGGQMVTNHPKSSCRGLITSQKKHSAVGNYLTIWKLVLAIFWIFCFQH